MGRIIKRLLALLIAGVLTAGCLAGCSPKKNEEESKAMGRYLETEIPLPEGTVKTYDLIQVDNGSIYLAAANKWGIPIVWKLSKDRDSWEEQYRFDIWKQPSEDNKYVSVDTDFELTPDGGAAVYLGLGNREDISGEDGKSLYYQLDNTGKITQIPYESSSVNYALKYGPDGNFYIMEDDFTVKRLDTDTGETEIIVDTNPRPRIFDTVGDTLYSVSGDNDLTVYDLESVESLPQDEGLAEALKQSGVSASVSYARRGEAVVFAGGTDEETMFFCNHEGLYRHTKDGSVTERVIDGGLTSMSQPDLGFISMEVAEDDDIYLLTCYNDEYKLLKYTYSEDIPTVPEKKIKAYSLYENPELLQAIAIYQKQNSDVYISMETGVTEQDAVTVSDALRTLSTEIMAGSGPDLLVLDGLPIASYIEKGLLAEITDIIESVDQEEGLFTNITSAFAQKGKICAVPLRFHMPVLEGTSETLENVTSLETLAEEAERLHEVNPDKGVLNGTMNGKEIAALLYDVCADAWVQTDGTIDRDKLQGFFTQLEKIYDVDGRSNETNQNNYSIRQYPGSISENTLDLHCDTINMNFGRIGSILDLMQIATTVKDKQGFGYELLKGQTENTFVPSCIVGINSKGNEIEASRTFLEYLLMDNAQSQSLGNGMPVNRQGMATLREKEGGQEVKLIKTYKDDNGEKDGDVEMWVKALTDADYESYLEKVEQLENPSLTSEVIRQAVMQQVDDCVEDKVTPAEAAGKVADTVNLYLAEG